MKVFFIESEYKKYKKQPTSIKSKNIGK